MYYNRSGEPIELFEWAELMNSDRAVKQEKVGDYFISTVWLGLDHNFMGGTPLIFETMVFHQPSEHPWHDLEQERYTTEAQAIAGHDQMVAKYKDLIQDGG